MSRIHHREAGIRELPSDIISSNAISVPAERWNKVIVWRHCHHDPKHDENQPSTGPSPVRVRYHAEQCCYRHHTSMLHHKRIVSRPMIATTAVNTSARYRLNVILPAPCSPHFTIVSFCRAHAKKCMQCKGHQSIFVLSRIVQSLQRVPSNASIASMSNEATMLQPVQGSSAATVPPIRETLLQAHISASTFLSQMIQGPVSAPE